MVNSSGCEMSGQISAPGHLTADLRNLLASDFLIVRWRRQSYLTQLAVRKPREHKAWRQQTLINHYKLCRVRESLSNSQLGTERSPLRLALSHLQTLLKTWKEKEGRRGRRKGGRGRERQRETGTDTEKYPWSPSTVMELPTVPLTPPALTAQGCPEGHVPRLKRRTEACRGAPDQPGRRQRPSQGGPGYARDPGRNKPARPPGPHTSSFRERLDTFFSILAAVFSAPRPFFSFLPFLPIALGPRRLLNRL